MALFESGGGSSAQLLDAEVSGLDALDLPVPPRPTRGARVWAAAWPKLLAIAIAIFAWQVVVWSGWKEQSVLPGPRKVFPAFVDDWATIWRASQTTLLRLGQGFAISLVFGMTLGALVARNKVLRAALGSMISGLQTMPSIAWFPLAIVLFGLKESAILFVVVLGAAPSIANGLIGGIDHIQPILLRAGRVMGARRWKEFRYVILPAALPSFVGGLKQAWAFAWRSLLAGEVVVLIANKPSLGHQLQVDKDNIAYPSMMAVMIAILVIGILIDSFIFSRAERVIRKRYGLIDEATQ